ncbi:MAG: hypothetical protein Q9191_005247 [Dirinaria sp. TL-2023a]
MLIRSFIGFSAAIPTILAHVQFTSPSAGDSLPGEKPISIAWKDSGDDPPISALDSYSIYLYAGGNTPGTFQQIGGPIAYKADFSPGHSVNGSVPVSSGASIDNAYFLQMISAAKDGGTITTYSPRFSLTGMIGSFAPAIERAALNVHGTSGPGLQNNIVSDVDHQHKMEARAAQGAVPAGGAAAAAAPAAGGQAASAAIDYTAQTGLTKFAPMQGHPGTKITKQSASPRYPTSSVSFYKTFAPTPHQVTTQTLTNTYSISSRENPATPAPDPQDAMQKYLARWRD